MTTTTDAARELFAVTDLLAGQAMLRRSLTDPSASADQRAGLVRKLLTGKVGAEALKDLEGIARKAWASPTALLTGLERRAVTRAFEGASSEGALERVSRELYVIQKSVADSADLTGLLRSPAYETSAKRALIGRLVGEEAHPVTRLLADRAVDGHRRTFAANVEDYLGIAAEMSSVAVARVTVAKPLDEARLTRLRDGLTKQVGRPVRLQVDVDPAVLGGINVAIGDDVYESTVAARLDDVRRQLINS